MLSSWPRHICLSHSSLLRKTTRESRSVLTRSATLPPTDLHKLVQEVLQDQPADAALPCNLSDQWLDLISRDLDVIFADTDADSMAPSKSHMAAPLALIVHILFAKQAGKSVTVAFEEVVHYLSDFRIEIALELITRRTNISADRPTVQTIFTKRPVQFAKLAD